MRTTNCVCNNCDAPYTDVESDEYLDSHFECESCGSDFPMEVLKITNVADESIYRCTTCDAEFASLKVNG